MNNCSLTTSEQITIRIYTKEETIELFGEEYLLEYGIELPESLLAEYNETMDKFWRLQDKLRRIYLKQE